MTFPRDIPFCVAIPLFSRRAEIRLSRRTEVQLTDFLAFWNAFTFNTDSKLLQRTRHCELSHLLQVFYVFPMYAVALEEPAMRSDDRELPGSGQTTSIA